jgi:hypothetical protein
MYLCVRGFNFASFYNFSIRFWNCSALTWKTAVLSHMWFLIRINLNFQPIGKNNWPQYPFLDNVENHPISINVDIWLLRQVNYKCEQTPKTTYYDNRWQHFKDICNGTLILLYSQILFLLVSIIFSGNEARPIS